MKCRYVKAPEEVSNECLNDGQLFNCEGVVYKYDREIHNLRKCGTDEEIHMRNFKKNYFFTGIWFRGGRKCRECDNRICGIDGEFFNYKSK